MTARPAPAPGQPPCALLVWEGGGNLGHLGRLMPVARRLRADGWRVVFAVARPQAASRLVAPAGFEWVPAPVALSVKGGAAVVCHSDLYLRHAFAQPEAAAGVVARWVALLRGVRAEVALVDASPLALYAARCIGLPAVALGHGFEFPLMHTEEPCFTPWAEDAGTRVRAAQAGLRENLQRLAGTLPGEAAARAPLTLGALFEPADSALCTWPELDHFERSAAERAARTCVGPIWSTPAGASAVPWPQRDGPKVLAYLNLVDKRYDLLWQALRRAGANVLVVSPGGNPAACAAARGWGIGVVENPVDLAPLLAPAAAVLTHGGMGTVAMALRAGKPLLLLPQHVEQGILAYRLSAQGLAAATVRLRNKEHLSTLTERLLADAAWQARLSAFAARHATWQPAHAVDAVVNLLHARRVAHP